MGNREYFFVHKTWIDVLKEAFPDNEAKYEKKKGDLIRAIVTYGIEQKETWFGTEIDLFLNLIYHEIDEEMAEDDGSYSASEMFK